MSENYTYDGKFTYNIFVFRQTGSGKATFIQSLVRNKMF